LNQEQIAVLIILTVFTLPGIIIGIVLCCGRGADLIAGYNTASPQERDKWDRKALCRGTGVLLLIIVVCMQLVGLGSILGRMVLLWSALGALVIFTAAGVLYINKSSRFRKK